jgi:hypothetical protein
MESFYFEHFELRQSVYAYKCILVKQRSNMNEMAIFHDFESGIARSNKLRPSGVWKK